ncbi:hypothetical protein [Blastococcus sp. URHD0036]|uniref:hypothetical protein n=1 Tax=Blastococcus sp. URHD0036 TaxID=1380356 RepID=UPI000495A4FB|nr:hypothetical protein [Blastococcus sp. URHD0036]
MTDLTTRQPGRGEPEESPPLGAAAPGTAEPLEETPRAIPQETPPGTPPVELSRLLALARLSPAQALEIAAEVLDAALRQPVPDGGAEEERVRGRVHVTADGRVLVATAAARGGRPVRVVLADVLAASVVPDPAADPAGDRLLGALSRAVAELPAAGVAGAARTVRAAAAPVDRPAVQGELGALVRAVAAVAGAGVPGGGSAPGAGVAGRPAAPRPATQVQPAGSTPARTGRRIGAWLASIVVLAGIVAAEVVVLRDDISADIDLLLDAGRGEEGDVDPEPAEPPVPAPAPPAAGAVAAVDLRALDACEPGAPCTVRLLIRVVPGAEQQVVPWTWSVVDRCTGAVTLAPGGTLTVPAGADRAAVVGIVALPALPALAVFAVTGPPAVAASPPVLVGTCLSGDGG